MNTQCSIYMERLQGVISPRAADTSGESSYCFGAASLVKKIRAVGSLKELDLVKDCGNPKMTYIKNKYAHWLFVLFSVLILNFIG